MLKSKTEKRFENKKKNAYKTKKFHSIIIKYDRARSDQKDRPINPPHPLYILMFFTSTGSKFRSNTHKHHKILLSNFKL